MCKNRVNLGYRLPIFFCSLINGSEMNPMPIDYMLSHMFARVWVWIMLLFTTAYGQQQRYAFEHNQMGTTFRIIMYTTDSLEAANAAQLAFGAIDTLNATMSDYSLESELSRLSATSGTDTWVKVSNDLWEVLKLAKAYGEQTQGAFDPTIGPLVQLWRRARRKNILPDTSQINEAQQAVGCQHIHMDSANQQVKLVKPDMRLDLGGIAKGYAVDRALMRLKDKGISSALVDGGGDIAIGDPPPHLEGWDIGLEMVDREGQLGRFTMQVSHCAVATSGDTYRSVEIDGITYSHIIDPKTGLGLTIRRKVTVIAPNGTAADAMASAVSVMGEKSGISWASTKANVEVLIITNQSGNLEQKSTQDFMTHVITP